jgi:ATP-dependent Clp protease protease subunit
MNDVFKPGIKRSWYNLTKEDTDDYARLYIYDDIGFFGVRAMDLIEEVNATGAKNLNVHINSYGGEIDEGVAIHSFLKRFPGKVNVHIDGMAASIASIIAMGGDTVSMAKAAFMFIHNPWTITAGDAEDLQREAQNLEKRKSALVGVYAQKTSLDAATIEKLMDDETLLSSAEAKEYGFIDLIDEGDDDEKQVSYAASMMGRVFCKLKKGAVTMPSETTAKNEADAHTETTVEVVVTTATEAVADDAEPVVEETDETVTEETEETASTAANDRAEFAQFCARFGDVRAAAYFKDGLSFADAERRFTDELIQENAALKAKQPAQASAGPVPVRVSDDQITKGRLWDQYAKLSDPKAKAEFFKANRNKMEKK